MAQYSTKEQVLSLGETHPEYAEFLKNNQIPELDFDDLPKVRQDLAPQGPMADGGEKHTFKTRDGHTSEFLIFKPTAPQARSPLVVLIYGGGFIMGVKEDMALIAKALAANLNATVYCPEYRLAPEHKFPTAAHDIWDFIEWLGANHQQHSGADPTAGFVVGGFSAGGNLAAVASRKILASDSYPLTLTGVFLGIPWLYGESSVPRRYQDLWLSREQNATVPMLNGRALQYMSTYYAQDDASPEFGPFLSGRAHPRTYLQVHGQDPLRDDGLIYEKVLRDEEGVETKIDVYPGLPHGFNHYLPMLPTSNKANADMLAGFAWLLS